MALEFHQFSYRSDNYGVLIHDAASGATACVDAGDAEATFAALDEKGWALSELWITHHHGDHTSHIGEIKQETGCKVIGPDYGSSIAGLDQAIKDGEIFDFAGQAVTPIHTPGHTLDMLNYYIADSQVLFAGDTLFVMGCGRLFEGTPEQMWESLQKLMALPDETIIYCAHEYTSANLEFALSVDTDNDALKNRGDIIRTLRNRGDSTVPTMLSVEKATNPFLRVSDPSIRSKLKLLDASETEVFADIRRRKDNF